MLCALAGRFIVAEGRDADGVSLDGHTSTNVAFSV